MDSWDNFEKACFTIDESTRLATLESAFIFDHNIRLHFTSTFGSIFILKITEYDQLFNENIQDFLHTINGSIGQQPIKIYLHWLVDFAKINKLLLTEETYANKNS
jgi:hypothetical protein